MIETVKEQSVQEIQSLEVPEDVWIWECPGGVALTISDYMVLATSAKGVTIAARPHMSVVKRGCRIGDGFPVQAKFPDEFNDAGITYVGFLLVDDNGIEITRFRAS